MFRHPKPLDREVHRHLRLAANQPYHFAASQMLIPVVFSEIRQIAREYPIVFPKGGQDVPSALVGVEKDVNAHVRETGHWMGRYIPAHVRRYPFLLGGYRNPEPEGGQRHVVMVDEDAPHLRGDQGEPLFTESGEKAPALEQVEKVLVALHKDYEKTRQLTGQLAGAGLFAEKPLAVHPKNEEPRRIAGFSVIDTERLRTLEGGAMSELVESGAMMLAYAHLFSLINLEDGWIAYSISRGASEKPDVPDIEALFGDNDDIFKFDS